MTQIEQMARRDAEIDFGEVERSRSGWAEYVGRVRGGSCVGPAVDVLADCGREGLCLSWGVDFGAWDRESGAWFLAYNWAYCAAIEAMCRAEATP